MKSFRKATGLLFFRDRAYASVKKTHCQYVTLFSRKKRLMDRVYKAQLVCPFFKNRAGLGVKDGPLEMLDINFFFLGEWQTLRVEE